MDVDAIATIGANLESGFDILAGFEKGRNDIEFHFSTYDSTKHTSRLELLDKKEISLDNGMDMVKCMAFKDDSGNLFVHFRGTGDGYWCENEGAYSNMPSTVQKESLEFYRDVIDSFYHSENIQNVYITGHSQGGNTAQYVTIASGEYGEYIDTCVSLDGPGFSSGLIEKVINENGEAHFSKQRDKIYAYNGEYDYVSPLGEKQIVPPDHVTYIQASENIAPMDFMNYHDVKGMMRGQSLNPKTANDGTEYSDFRKLVEAISANIAELPYEERLRAAQLTMKIGENYLGSDMLDEWGEKINFQSDSLNDADLDAFKELLFPLLIESFSENEDLIDSALKSIGLDEDTADLIEELIHNFNELPQDQREDLLNEVGDCLVIDDTTKKIGFSGDILSVFSAVTLILPTAWETVRDDPSGTVALLEEFGVWDKIKATILEHPGAAAVITGVVAVFHKPILALVKNYASFTNAVDAYYALVDRIKNMAQGVKNFVLTSLQSIKSAILNIKEYVYSKLPGAQYVTNSPYFRADPVLLREYAGRLSTVNTAIMRLDKHLDDLYWQVGLLDILDIISANILTHYSIRLGSAKNYLNSAAEILESADNQALECIGR